MENRNILRILALDGGGVRGIISATFLVETERLLKALRGETLTEHFDLIAGTSTGAILAAGAALGISGSRLLDIYTNECPNVFPYRHRWAVARLPALLKYGVSAPKYDNTALKAMLKATLGEATVGGPQAETDLLIPFYDTLRRRTLFFKSYETRMRTRPRFFGVPLWEAALCSASAPSYFPAHGLRANGVWYSAIDGGVAANNPTACAVADATILHPSKHVRVLSLGTGATYEPIPLGAAREWGAAEWAPRLVDVLMDAGLDKDRYVAARMVGPGNLLRLQPELDGRQWGIKGLSEAMDDASEQNIRALTSLAQRFLEAGASARLADFIR